MPDSKTPPGNRLLAVVKPKQQIRDMTDAELLAFAKQIVGKAKVSGDRGQRRQSA
jgi:hypothetical protein